MPITERLVLPVQGGVDTWKEPLKVMLQTLQKQDGYIRTRWGPFSEDNNQLELLVGWESTDAQKAFQASSDFTAMMEGMKPLLSATPTVYLVQFVPYAPKNVIDASIVQVITITGSSASADDLRNAVGKYASIPGCTGTSGGVAENEVEGQGKPFVGVVGWESLDASKASEKIDLGVDGSVEEHHVNFRYPVKGFRGL